MITWSQGRHRAEDSPVGWAIARVIAARGGSVDRRHRKPRGSAEQRHFLLGRAGSGAPSSTTTQTPSDAGVGAEQFEAWLNLARDPIAHKPIVLSLRVSLLWGAASLAAAWIVFARRDVLS